VGAAELIWMLIWALTPANRPGGIAKEAVPLWRFLRSRWVSQFTASKVFSDPAWYFYIFWSPPYRCGSP
jgi:hypothetical protein